MSPAAPTDYKPTLDAIRGKLPEKLQNPQIGIICGSGLSGLVDTLREVVIIQYDAIPGFGRSTGMCSCQEADRALIFYDLVVVQGHKSALAFGLLGSGEGVPVVAMLGRVRENYTLLIGVSAEGRVLVPSIRRAWALDCGIPRQSYGEAWNQGRPESVQSLISS